MKILHINKGYFPWIGGIETVVKQYAEYSFNHQHEITVLCCNKRFSLMTTYEIINNISVIRCSSLGILFSLPLSISFIFKFFKIYRKYDVIHFHEPFPLGSLVSFFISSKRHIIVTWHSDIIRQKIIKIPFLYFQKKLCSKAKVITTTSELLYSNSEIISSYKNISILPLSINPKHYITNFKKQYFSLPQKYLLFFGRYSVYKGLKILLAASNSSKLNDIKIVIAGNGKLNAEEQQLISTNPNIIILTKEFTEEEKLYLFANCYAFLFPSITNNEAFGITQLEAMIYGKPVINTNLETAVPWVSINNFSGYTVKPQNVEALEKAIIKIWECPDEEYEQLSKNARNRVLSIFSDEIVLNKLHLLYE